MAGFELIDRDGLARIGELPTPHGRIATPALLPVVHPDPSRQPVAPRELRSKFGLGAVITSAYIAWRTPPLREVAESKGIHGLLNFDGPVMTDSGAFQQHAFGRVEVTSDEIHSFQRRIGSDILTVLDEFTEPETSAVVAEAAVDATIERARQARAMHRGLLAVPVQGGRWESLRLRSAQAASEIGEVLAVGGVVPLLERYRFGDLARALVAARPGLAPERAVHLFGAGHPMTFAFSTLFGVDLFDSSAYVKFARRGDLLFAHGTVPLDRIRERTCACVLCAERPLTEVAKLPAPDRKTWLARHNLLMSAVEMANVRQAIRDGTLWELAELRAAAHPALQAGLRAAVRGVRVFLPTEPESRTTFRLAGPLSALRPAAIGYLARLRQYVTHRGPSRSHPWVALTPEALHRTPTLDSSGTEVQWDCPTPLGPVPVELSEIYPVGCALAQDEFDGGLAGRRDSVEPSELDLAGLADTSGRDWTPEWTARQSRALLTWRYGSELAESLGSGGRAVGRRSRRTGRLRRLVDHERTTFVVGNDGLARPTWYGATLLHANLPFPRSRVVIEPDAVEFVGEGRSLFAAFVRDADAALVPGSSALLVDPDDRLVAVGRLLLAPPEMRRFHRGVAARVTAHAHAPAESPDSAG